MAGTAATLNLFQFYHAMSIITLFVGPVYCDIAPCLPNRFYRDCELYTHSLVYDDGKGFRRGFTKSQYFRGTTQLVGPNITPSINRLFD